MNELQKLLTPQNVAKLTSVNQANLKKVASGGKIEYLSLRELVLIGKHPYPEGKAIEAEMRERDFSEGELQVQRHAIVGKGEIKASPPPRNRSEFEDYIARISKKKVFYA